MNSSLQHRRRVYAIAPIIERDLSRQAHPVSGPRLALDDDSARGALEGGRPGSRSAAKGSAGLATIDASPATKATQEVSSPRGEQLAPPSARCLTTMAPRAVSNDPPLPPTRSGEGWLPPARCEGWARLARCRASTSAAASAAAAADRLAAPLPPSPAPRPTVEYLGERTCYVSTGAPGLIAAKPHQSIYLRRYATSPGQRVVGFEVRRPEKAAARRDG